MSVPNARLSKRSYDIIVFGCTGNAGRAVAYHVIRSAATSSINVALSGRSKSKVEKVLHGIRDELGDTRAQNDANIGIVIADACDEQSMLKLAQTTKVLISCAGPYGRYGEAAVKACVTSGTHYLDITGEVSWVERMLNDYDAKAKEAGVTLLPFAGYDCVPAELGLMLVDNALKTDDDSKLAEISLYFRAKGGGLPRGTLQTMLDGFEGKTPSKKQGDVRLYPKEYKKTAKRALSLLGSLVPKWSPSLGVFTAPNFMTVVNVPVLCRAASIFGVSSNLSISDRSVVSAKPTLLNGYGLFPTLLYILALIVGCLLLAFPPFRWWLRNRLNTYSYGGNPAGKVILDVYGRSACQKSATAHCVFPGDAGIYATGLFAVGVANALLEATTTVSKYPPPPTGFRTPVAALHRCRPGLIVEHLKRLGAEIKVEEDVAQKVNASKKEQ